MPRPPSDKRERLTAAAIHLARREGLDATTLSAIADAAGVPQGSVYYYFKTKTDVAQAVAEGIAESLSAQRTALDGPPADALVGFLHAYVTDGDTVRAYGSLLATSSAGTGSNRAHHEALAWLTDRFAELGFAAEAARARAIHLLAGVEGGASLAHALDDPEPLKREAAHLERWVRSTQG